MLTGGNRGVFRCRWSFGTVLPNFIHFYSHDAQRIFFASCLDKAYVMIYWNLIRNPSATFSFSSRPTGKTFHPLNCKGMAICRVVQHVNDAKVYPERMASFAKQPKNVGGTAVLRNLPFHLWRKQQLLGQPHASLLSSPRHLFTPKKDRFFRPQRTSVVVSSSRVRTMEIQLPSTTQ